MTDNFLVVWALNVPYPSYDMYTAPMAHLSDGYMDLLYLTDTTKYKLTSVFLSIENGSHVNDAVVEYVKVKAIRLTPRNQERTSQIGIDGERIPYLPVEIRCYRGILNFMCK